MKNIFIHALLLWAVLVASITGLIASPSVKVKDVSAVKGSLESRAEPIPFEGGDGEEVGGGGGHGSGSEEGGGSSGGGGGQHGGGQGGDDPQSGRGNQRGNGDGGQQDPPPAPAPNPARVQWPTIDSATRDGLVRLVRNEDPPSSDAGDSPGSSPGSGSSSLSGTARSDPTLNFLLPFIKKPDSIWTFWNIINDEAAPRTANRIINEYFTSKDNNGYVTQFIKTELFNGEPGIMRYRDMIMDNLDKADIDPAVLDTLSVVMVKESGTVEAIRAGFQVLGKNFAGPDTAEFTPDQADAWTAMSTNNAFVQGSMRLLEKYGPNFGNAAIGKVVISTKPSPPNTQPDISIVIQLTR